MLAIQTEPSSPSLSRVPLDEVLPSSLGRTCCCWVSQIMCWQLTASCMDGPSIFPPGAIQKSIVCPGRLQLGKNGSVGQVLLLPILLLPLLGAMHLEVELHPCLHKFNQ